MTPDEARTKWCPFARAPSRIDGDSEDHMPIAGINREPLGELDVGAFCLADECMAWRWAYSPQQAARDRMPGAAQFKPAGYCGLAGAHGLD